MKLASLLNPQRLNAADLSDVAFDLIVSLGTPGGGVGAVGGATHGSAGVHWLHDDGFRKTTLPAKLDR